jgi:hypothetical protein
MEGWIAPSQIESIFSEELTNAGGKVTDTFANRGLLFTRSTLPEFTEVAPKDRLQPGVALRANDAEIVVSPYIFRLVCTNGAIAARAVHSRRISRDEWFLDDQAESDLQTTLRIAIRNCCQREAFAPPIDQMRQAIDSTTNMALMISTLLTRHRSSFARATMQEILGRYNRSRDRSTYGLINAVTSVARDTRDPQVKWRLEELGGEIAYWQTTRPRNLTSASRRGVLTGSF